MNTDGLYVTLNEQELVQFAAYLKPWLTTLETWERNGSGTEQAKYLVSGSGAESGCEKRWLERERGTERGAGVTEMDLCDDRKFSRSAHMLCWRMPV